MEIRKVVSEMKADFAGPRFWVRLGMWIGTVTALGFIPQAFRHQHYIAYLAIYLYAVVTFNVADYVVDCIWPKGGVRPTWEAMVVSATFFVGAGVVLVGLFVAGPAVNGLFRAVFPPAPPPPAYRWLPVTGVEHPYQAYVDSATGRLRFTVTNADGIWLVTDEWKVNDEGQASTEYDTEQHAVQAAEGMAKR